MDCQTGGVDHPDPKPAAATGPAATTGPAAGTGPAAAPAGYLRALALAATGYLVFHHVGSLPGGLGEVGVTRWADWLDLLTPFAVVLPAAYALRAAQASGRLWVTFIVAAIGYVQGQGMHLAANSIGNARPGEAAHFWDEVAGHALWYGGAALLMGCLAVTMSRVTRPRTWAPPLLAIGVGLTWWTNAVGGGTLWLSLPVAAALVGYGWRHRASLAVLLLIGFAPAAGLCLWLVLSAAT